MVITEYPEDGNISQEEETEDYTETEEDELKGTEEEESPKKELKSKKRKASASKAKGKAKVRPPRSITLRHISGVRLVTFDLTVDVFITSEKKEGNRIGE